LGENELEALLDHIMENTDNTTVTVTQDEELDDAMDRAKNTPSSENIHHLIKKLQEKLGDDHDHDYHQLALPGSPGLTGSHLAPNRHLNSTLHNGSSRDADSLDIDDDGGGGPSSKSLNTDTIVLVGSLIVMILIGLIFHRIISYLAKLRSRRRQYQRGLKQLGDHMHVVTRQLSNPASLSGTPTATPSISMRKLAALNSQAMAAAAASSSTVSNNNNCINISTIPDDDNSVFKPSTHVMRREDSALGVMTTAALQLKRHQELHHVADD